MPVTRYGRSPWIEGVPKKKRPSWPAFSGEREADLVIIGGGLAGVMAAYACAAAGVAPLLLEAGSIGEAGSGHGSGVFSGEASSSFLGLEKSAGRRVARVHFEHTRRAALDLAAAVKRLGIKARLEARHAWKVVPEAGMVKPLRRDTDERRGAGLEVSWQRSAGVEAATGIADTEGGVRMDGWGICDPYRLVLGFAVAAEDRGAELFEHSPVRRVTFDRKRATVITARGRIVSTRVVHCTGEPTDLVRALKRHFHFAQRAIVMTEPVPGRVRKGLGPGTAIVVDTDAPPHEIHWTEDRRLVVAGADGPRVPGRLLEKYHVQRTGQLMYELTRLYPDVSGVLPAYGWSMPLAHSLDGGLYAGPHRNFPHQLFAFGTAHDPARAFLASRVIARHVLAEHTSDDERLGFGRVL